MSKFTKNQTVYYASTRFATTANECFLAVVERVVDACGKKQITFFNRNNMDFVFGRRATMAFPIFATAEDAFAYLESFVAERAKWNAVEKYTILARVRPDYAPDFKDLTAR